MYKKGSPPRTLQAAPAGGSADSIILAEASPPTPWPLTSDEPTCWPCPAACVVHKTKNACKHPQRPRTTHTCQEYWVVRRSRTKFTRQQIDKLEDKFRTQKYLTKITCWELADTVGLTAQQVRRWFQNRRNKWRKNCCEMEWSRQREKAAAMQYKERKCMHAMMC